MFPLSPSEIDIFVKAALAEDMGTGGDVTSRATIPEAARFRGVMDTRDTIVVAGLPLVDAFFKALDPHCVIKHHAKDGDARGAGTDLLMMEGNGRAMLTAERAALNTLQMLSGIATLTRQYVEAIAGTGAILLDTRKTIPGFRALSKYAARLGGAQNHRMRLDDGLLIKDNHIAVAGGVKAAVDAALAANTGLLIQVECDSLEQVKQALAAGAQRLLLDNMSNDQLRACVAEVAGRVPTEASGGVRLDTIRAIAETGVTYISVGRITQSAPAADIGLDFTSL
jgi:nicotinate-nucleotide pyrophosphorylase (carboxylating)